MDDLVTIITIAYNSEAYIEATIESVLVQSYTCLEYLIIDGASSDKTVEVSGKYRGALEAKGIIYRIISEPDQGIYDAMNKGIRLASGKLIGILNSGDWYEPDAVENAVRVYRKTGCDLLYGDIRIHRQDGSTFVKKAVKRNFQTSRDWNHPTMFVKSELYKRYPFRCKGIHDDYGFYLQMLAMGKKIEIVSRVMADFRMGGASNRKSFCAATRRIRDRYKWCYRINGYSRWYIVECVLIEAAKMILG